MLDILNVLLDVLMFIVLAIIFVGVLVMITAAVYLGGQELKANYADVEKWLQKRRQTASTADLIKKVSLGLMSVNDARREMNLPQPEPKRYASIFDMVADEHGLNPMEISPEIRHSAEVTYEPLEVLVASRSRTRPTSIFDQVLVERPLDPRDALRAKKERDALDAQTIERATEYHHGIA